MEIEKIYVLVALVYTYKGSAQAALIYLEALRLEAVAER